MKAIALIDRRTQKICLGLTDACNRTLYAWTRDACGRLQHDAWIEVQRAGCTDCSPGPQPAAPCSSCGLLRCSGGPTPWPVTGAERCQCAPQAPQGQVIRYEAFDGDTEGRTCFFFDDKLLQAQLGRYDVKLYVKGVHVDSFQLELRDRLRVSTITKQQATGAY